MRIILRNLAAALLPLAAAITVAGTAQAQEGPAKRLSSIVGVAMAEYGLGIDASGRLVNQLEFEEAVTFLADARDVDARLSGERAPLTKALLDSLAAGVSARVPPAQLAGLHERFTASLGAAGALDLPTQALDLAEGRALYQQHCASCHGTTGGGDGPAGAGMDPPPPALGSAEDMHDVSPALMFRVHASAR